MRYALLLLVVFSVGCVDHTRIDADARQAAETKRRLDEADKQVGMPDITSFRERKLARDILERRDKELTTFTYITSMTGELVFLGESIGYGLPY